MNYFRCYLRFSVAITKFSVRKVKLCLNTILSDYEIFCFNYLNCNEIVLHSVRSSKTIISPFVDCKCK